MSDIKTRLKTAISNNLTTGLEQLRQFLQVNSKAFNEVLLLQSRHSDNERARNNNQIDHKEYDLIRSQIINAALNLIDTLDDAQTKYSDEHIKDLIRQLHINKDKIGPLYLVNCDRHQLADQHWGSFDKKVAQSKLQFYFLPACPLQKPPSFAERMVWELLIEELEEELDGLHYESKADSIRVKKADFEIGSRQRNTERALKKYFCKRFKAESFEDLLERDLADSGYDYIATLFTVEINEWKDFMPQFLQWMIQTFKETPHKDAPTFIFYVVVFMDQFIREPQDDAQKRIKREVKDLIEQHKECCTLLEGFEPIYNQDIERWFRKIGEDRPLLVKEVVDTFMNSLPMTEKARYLAQKGIDMARMERLQQMVYEVSEE